MAKTTKEKIEVMQAYEEGKQIEFRCADRNVNNDDWCILSKSVTPTWNWRIFDYRIKGESKYRPYKDTEEMINDFCERSGAKRSKMGEPFIWVKYGVGKILILDFEEEVVWTKSARWSMQELFESFTYCDGSPIGKKE